MLLILLISSMLWVSCSPQDGISDLSAPVRLAFSVSYEADAPVDSSFTPLVSQRMPAALTDDHPTLLILDVTSADETTPALNLHYQQGGVDLLSPELDLSPTRHVLMFVYATEEFDYDEVTGLLSFPRQYYSYPTHPYGVFVSTMTLDLTHGLNQTVPVSLSRFSATLRVTIAELINVSSTYTIRALYKSPVAFRPTGTGLLPAAETRDTESHLRVNQIVMNASVNQQPKVLDFGLVLGGPATMKVGISARNDQNNLVKSVCYKELTGVELKPGQLTIVEPFILFPK